MRTNIKIRVQVPYLYRKDVTKWIYEIRSRAYITEFYENTKHSEKKFKIKHEVFQRRLLKIILFLKISFCR